jgi:pimeloyl-ACP methyl ester carboxylesterase
VATVTSLATPHPKAMQQSMFTSTQGLKSSYMLFFMLPRLPEAMFRSEQGGRRVRRAFEGSGMTPTDAAARLDELRAGALTPAMSWYRAVPVDARSGPGPVEVPTLYVYPSADVALGRKAADLTAQHVTGPYRFEVLEGANHWIPEQEADTVAALLLEHLAAHPA